MATIETKDKNEQVVEVTLPNLYDSGDVCECGRRHVHFVQPVKVGKVVYEPNQFSTTDPRAKKYLVTPAIAKQIQAEIDKAEKEPWEYVTIPRADVHNYRFASGKIVIQGDVFESGKTHKVPASVATSIKQVIEARQSHDLKLLSREINVEALQQALGAPDSLTKAASGGASPLVGSPGAIADLQTQLLSRG
jgi:hypothetical protein